MNRFLFKSLVALSFIHGSVMTSTTAFASRPSQDIPASERNCRKYLRQIDRLTNQEFIFICANTFFKGWKDDNFINSLTYVRRLSELNINDSDTFGNVIYLHYSRYTYWVKDQSNLITLPLAQEMDRALKFSERRFANPRWKKNGDAYFEAAYIFKTAGELYDKKYLPAAIRYLKKADEQATVQGDMPLLVKTRLQLGHLYRFRGDKKLARAAYQRVLDVEPDNIVALKYLKELAA